MSENVLYFNLTVVLCVRVFFFRLLQISLARIYASLDIN